MNYISLNNREKIARHLRRRLSKQRYIHSISVSYISTALAMIYDVPIYDAMVAGLLHDYAKDMSSEDQLEFCRKHRIEITEYERKNPAIIHGKVGAFYIMKRFGIKNRDVINAIINHTIGRVNMSMLEKIIFVADYIEPEREELPRILDIRKEAYRNIDKAVFMIYENTIDYIHSKGREVDACSLEALEFYKRRQNDK